MDSRRYYGLDALRGTMMLLGIVLHAGGFYVSSPPPAMKGMPLDGNTSYLFDLSFHFIHSFRMPLFFVLAGFFAALLVEKRGMWGTYRDRAARVLAPLVAAVFTILPVVIVFVMDFMVARRFGIMQVLPDLERVRLIGMEMKAAGWPADEPSIGHLWFLLYLCYFYLLMPLCRLLVEASAPASGRIEAFLASPWAFAAFASITAATLWPFQGGQVHEGFLFLKPHVPSLVYYGSFFVLGYAFHRYRVVLPAFVRLAPACAWLAAVLFPLSLGLSHLEHAATDRHAAYHLAAVIAHACCTWAIIYAVTGAILRFFDYESPWILYISQSAYWVYLVHMIFVVIAAWLLVPYDVHAAVKFAIVAAVTTVGSFATYHYLVQRTWVSRFLHGKRFDLDWPWRVKAPAAKAAVEA
jgi:peptidoglycan/LPS O-acetylase OafA/YrhL